MSESVDLSTAPLLGPIQEETGRLDSVPSWQVALLQARDALAGRPSTTGGGFRLRLDTQGRADLEVSDLPSLSRLENAIANAAIRTSDVDVIQTVDERPAVPVRAVLECFYGELWSARSRATVLAAAVSRGANAYVYGPSADRRTGGLWREKYTGTLRDDLRTFAGEAKASGVRPIWRVSPAAPLEPTAALRPGQESDIRALLAKVDNVLDLGFEAVLIAFDDITAGLDPSSAERFAGAEHPLAVAHAAVVNRVAAHVGAEKVLACPTHYWGASPSSYRRAFGRDLAPGIAVCWTGPAVISDTIGADAAAAVAEELGHPVFLWDNYPVNDWDVLTIGGPGFQGDTGLDNLVSPRRLPLAPLRGRDSRLLDEVSGYGGNAAIDPLTGIPALSTALDFAWSGARYHPDRSWTAALRATGLDLQALDLLADAAGPLSASARPDAPRLAKACARVLAADGQEQRDALQRLDLVVAEHREAVARLRERPGPMLDELRPWIHELARQCTLAALAHRAITASSEERSALAKELSAALARPSSVAVAVGAARPLAEYARGLVSGGTPDLPLTLV